MPPVSRAAKKRKRNKKSSRSNKLNITNNRDKTTCDKSVKTTSDSDSESDNDTKDDAPSAPLLTNTKSATQNKNTKSEHIAHTDTNMAQNTRYNVDVHNTYESLNEEEPDNMELDKESEDTNAKPPPPIIIHKQTTNHKTLVEQIKNTVKGEFTIRYTKNTTNITINNRAERTQYMNTLIEQQAEFHTYTDKIDKTHAFVIRGLAEDEQQQKWSSIYSQHTTSQPSIATV